MPVSISLLCTTGNSTVDGVSAIFNTDQGRQFTYDSFVKVLKDAGVEISMVGQRRRRDNIHVERFWCTLKYEDIYLRSHETVRDLKLGLSRYFRFYNSSRLHQSLDYRTSDGMHESFRVEGERAAA